MAPSTHGGPAGEDGALRDSRIDGPHREPSAAGRVLPVDDDPLIRDVYARILCRVGCVVETAASAVAALEILGAGSFDLVVTDISMTEMSGTQFLRAIRERNLDVPVILMTAVPGVETTREAMDYGAFRYLIVNAAHAIGDVVKGSDRKGVITVRTRQDGESILISIADTGTGIPAAIGQRVFEPFFTTKAIGSGTGQGLALAMAVVKDRHKGDVSFESKDGSGTTFSVRLPIAGWQETRSQPG